MTVKIFKLVTGEDLIGGATESADSFTLKAPAVIMLQNTEKGVSVAIAPYAPMIEKNLVLYKTAIVSFGDPDIQLENEYNVRFGSGLVIAGA